ncbi:MAG: PorV/PorQ family protein [Deferribacteres bacterium]|nr:PorV/PorQ family protein [candidate division KSB1 bacterium]MCB9509610.1 PorV/PorQ family protein [Deferribacteres bacterium]
MKSFLYGLRVCLGIILVPIILLAQEEADLLPTNFATDITNSGTNAASFLTIGVGARAQAMGNASIAINADASALYWNPGAVASLNGFSLVVDHTEWLADTKLDFIGMVFPIPRVGAFGVSVLSLQSISDQPVRTILQPDGTGETYSAGNLSLAATLSLSLTDRFAIGVTGKYINESLWNETAATFAADIGVVYQTRLPGLRLAATISNFGGDMKLSGRDLVRPYDDDPGNYSNDRLNVALKTDAFPLPLYFRFGFGYTLLNTGMNQFLVTADLLHPSDSNEAINFGAEYIAFKTLSLRGGYRSIFEKDRLGGMTFGVGLSRPLIGGLNLGFDYSYADWGILENTQRISISLSY